MAPRSWPATLVAALCGALALASRASAANEESAEVHRFWYNSESGETAVENPLPSKHFDPKSGQDYWMLPNGETQWERPTEMAWYRTESEDHDGREYYINADTKESSWDLPPMFAWKRLNGNSKFYFNTITGKTQRERPEEIGHVDEKTGRTYWIDKRTGDATWESEHWWTEVPIDEADDPELIGRSYWQQEITKEVQWEKPEVEGWVEWFDEHKDEL